VSQDLNNTDFMPGLVDLQHLGKLGEGRQAEVFAWPGGVVKLYRSLAAAAARSEAVAMRSLRDAGIPMARFLGTVSIEGRPGIIMQRLQGPDQLSLLGRKPWTIWSVGRKLGVLHAQLHSAAPPDELEPLTGALAREIGRSDSVPRQYKDLALSQLERLPEGASICHWDFHPGNVIETVEGPKVIDWMSVTRGAALADVARTLLILRSGAVPPGAPFLVRWLTAIGRGVLVWRYLQAYRQRRPYEDRELTGWGVVNAASRLTYGIPQERSHLLERLERERRKLV
jgi:Ser/Thr protein kinase RdoA (MazF antagonist)